MAIPCEALATKAELAALATKAELQELREQINQLLGQPEEENGQQIDVLGLGGLAGTALAGAIIKAKDAITNIEFIGNSGGDLSKAISKGNVIPFKTKNGQKTILKGLEKPMKTLAGKANLGAQAAKVGASTLSIVANLVTIIGTLGINIATVKILGNRIDQVEKAQLGFNQDYTNLINILNRNNQDIEAANADISELQGLISEQQIINSELANDIESAQDNIDDLVLTVEKQQEAYNNLETVLEDFKTEVAEFQINTEEQVEDLNLTITDLESNLNIAKGNINILYEVIEQLSIDLADAQKRITEQEIKITQLEITSSVIIADIINLRSAIEADQDLTDARLSSLEAEIILAKNNVSRGGVSTPSTVRETIVNQQNKTLELMNQLSTDPVADLPTITYQDILFGNNPFNSFFNQLFPTINPTSQIGGELVNFEEFNVNQEARFTELATAMAALTTVTNNINLQTTAQAITTATETAVCNTTAPGGCLTANLRNPLQQGQNTIQNLVSNVLQGLDLFQGQTILNRVTENNALLKNAEFGLQAINNFAKKAWENAKLDKVLNVLNTILALHNAAMLSRNLAQTVGDIATQALQFFGIKDAEDNLIDVNQFLGNTFQTWITNMIGTETYANIQTTWTSLNRIMVAAQGVVFAVQGIKNAMLEGLETVGNWTAKIGNNMMIQGLLEERSFPWMNENINFRNPFSKFLQKIDTTEEIVGQVNSLVSSGIEAQENFNQLFEGTEQVQTASQELQENLSNFDTGKEATEAQENLSSASPEISNQDLIKDES